MAAHGAKQSFGKFALWMLPPRPGIPSQISRDGSAITISFEQAVEHRSELVEYCRFMVSNKAIDGYKRFKAPLVTTWNPVHDSNRPFVKCLTEIRRESRLEPWGGEIEECPDFQGQQAAAEIDKVHGQGRRLEGFEQNR